MNTAASKRTDFSEALHALLKDGTTFGAVSTLMVLSL